MWFNSVLRLTTTFFFVGIVYAGCPAMMGSYEYGKVVFQNVSHRQADLINDGVVLNDDNPGSLFWATLPMEQQESLLVNKSLALIFAAQFYDKLGAASQSTNAQNLVGLTNVSSCLPQNDRCVVVDHVCNATEIYQNLSGFCNNLNNPLMSAQNAPYFRLGQPNYVDAVNEMPRGYITNDTLPSVRFIGNQAIKKLPFTSFPTRVGNYGGLIYGKLAGVDLGRRMPYQNFNGGEGLRCCTADNQQALADDVKPFGCEAIVIPDDDPILPNYNVKCLNYVRSQTTLPLNCNIGISQKQNHQTGFLDLSTLYGSNEKELAPLRSFRNGNIAMANRVLPLNPNCTSVDGSCYTLGDNRPLLQPTFALMYSMLLRFHNSIADQLTALHADWNDETLFQETRRIVIAIHQHVVYNEWLPLFLGESMVQQYNLTCSTDSLYCGQYDPTIDPTPSHAFSQGAFRLFHAFVPSFFNTYDLDYSIVAATNTSDSVINLNVLNTQYEDYVRGYMLTSVQFDTYTQEMRNNVLRTPGKPIGVDVLSNDILIGRDHGILPYYVFKDQVMGTTSTQWTDLEDVISPENVAVLQSVYQSVFDVDLYVGMTLEQKNGTYLGPIGQYILATQFSRSKFGNRFFYTFQNGPNPFTSEQMAEIKRYSLAHLYCEVTDILEVQPRAMEVPSNNTNNAFRSCVEYSAFDVSLF